MGMCMSHTSSSVGPTSSLKLILPDGKLQEFDHPIRPSYILQRDSDYFICDADDMEFKCCVTPLGFNEELRLGQIYFMLPKSMLKRPICPEDLARMAVKASKALENGKTPLDLSLTAEKRSVRQKSRRGGAASSKASGKGSRFALELSVIVE